MDWPLTIAIIAGVALAMVGIVALGVWLLDESPRPAPAPPASVPDPSARPASAGLALD